MRERNSGEQNYIPRRSWEFPGQDRDLLEGQRNALVKSKLSACTLPRAMMMALIAWFTEPAPIPAVQRGSECRRGCGLV